jgi:hypothetical protein
MLLAVIRARHQLTQEALGALFGVSDTTALRVISRWGPALVFAGIGGVCLPAGSRARTPLSALLADIPELAAFTGETVGSPDALTPCRVG